MEAEQTAWEPPLDCAADRRPVAPAVGIATAASIAWVVNALDEATRHRHHRSADGALRGAYRPAWQATPSADRVRAMDRGTTDRPRQRRYHRLHPRTTRPALWRKEERPPPFLPAAT